MIIQAEVCLWWRHSRPVTQRVKCDNQFKMRDLGEVSEDDMVLAFLQAEIDSPRWRSCYQTDSVFDRSVIDLPDKRSPQENQTSRELLGRVRGYGRNGLLFTGFPVAVVWHRIILEQAELPKLKYANHPAWVRLSGGTRLVVDGARSLRSPENPVEAAFAHIPAIVEDVKGGMRYPPLIGVHQKDTENILLIEGHSRATAYAVAQLPSQFECIVGSSLTINSWAFY